MKGFKGLCEDCPEYKTCPLCDSCKYDDSPFDMCVLCAKECQFELEEEEEE